MKNNSVEDLIIYQKYMDLIYYTEMITEKYPRVSKTSTVSTIKNTTYDGMKYILLAYKVYEKKDKLDNLNKLDVNLKMLKVLVRVSYKKKYITIRNYEAWCRKINIVGTFLGGWINSCVKQ